MSSPISMLDVESLHAPIESELEAAILRVVRSGQYILGPDVEQFEQEAAGYLGVEHAIGVSSGTDALLVSLMALGIGAGDEVVTTPFSFFATVGCVLRLGATPVFVDIDPGTFNLDASKLEAQLTPRTRAIMPVHLFGQPCGMEPVLELARERGLAVVEDAAQSMGARTPLGMAGALGDLGCFSFFPSKNLGGLGDGGMVVTDDSSLAESVRTLRAHGAPRKYHHDRVGGNFRLDALQAAALRVKLPCLDAWNGARRERAAWYLELLDEARLLDRVTPPAQGAQDHTYNQFVIRVADRDGVSRALAREGIPTATYYPLALHQQPPVAELLPRSSSFPEAERACREALALPLHPNLDKQQCGSVISTLAAALSRTT